MNFRKTKNLVAVVTAFFAMAMTSCVAPVLDQVRGDGTARGIDVETIPPTSHDPAAGPYPGVDTSSGNCQYVWGPWESTGTPGEYERSHITLKGRRNANFAACPSGSQTEMLAAAPLDTYEFDCADAYANGDFAGCSGIYPGSNEIKDIVATGTPIPIIVHQQSGLPANANNLFFEDSRLFPLTQNIDPETQMKLMRPGYPTAQDSDATARANVVNALASDSNYEDAVGGVYVNTIDLFILPNDATNIGNRGLVLVSKTPDEQQPNNGRNQNMLMTIPDAAAGGPRTRVRDLSNQNRIVYVGKVNQDGSRDGTGTSEGCTGLNLGFVQNSCILVYNSVYELDDMGARDGAADEYAENRLLVVAAAISQIARVFGLTAREATQVMLRAADKSCNAEAWCGQGYLDLTKLFDAENGQVKVALEAGVSTSSQQGEGLSFSPGSVSLPGLQDEVAVMGFNQYVDKPLNLVRSSESVEVSFEPSDTDLRTFGTRTGFGFAMSSEAFGYCRNGVCPYVSVKGEAGVKRFASDGLAYFVSYRRTDDFFGGEGTGSLGFGQTDNLAAGIKYTRELDGNLDLSLGADLVHGRAGDGELIGDLRGTLFRPGLELRREEPLTSGARRAMVLDLRQNNFTGGFRVPGATHKLRERDWEASLSFEFQH